MISPPPRRPPKPLLALAAFLVFLLGLVFVPTPADAAEVTLLVRPVQVKHKGETEWKTLNMGDQVREGDSVRTGSGARVELSISPRRQFRIGAVTEIEIRELDEKKVGMKAKIGLILGRFWGSLRRPLRQGRGEEFSVATATAVIGIKGTTFGVDYDKETNVSQVSVVSGQVGVVPPKPPEEPTEIAGPREIAPPQEISRDEWTKVVSADQKLVIRPGEEPTTAPLTDEDKADEWIAFNIARDRENP